MEYLFLHQNKKLVSLKQEGERLECSSTVLVRRKSDCTFAVWVLPVPRVPWVVPPQSVPTRVEEERSQTFSSRTSWVELMIGSHLNSVSL